MATKKSASSAALHAGFLRWNSKQPNPMPLCVRCQTPYDESDAGELWTRLCFSCEANRLYAVVRRLMRQHGRPAARRKLVALARITKRVDACVTV